MKIAKKDVVVPLTVPSGMKEEYIKNYLEITKESGRLMLFAGDQKIEHMNGDFYGKDVHKDDFTPEHLFNIASRSRIGVFAAQLGLIARYGMDYRNVPYLVKLNSKTNLVPESQAEPFSGMLADVDDAVELKKNSGLKILAVGYTLYLGSEFESKMIEAASRVILDAHNNGLITVLWIYPRGKAVKDDKDPHLIAGATGVGACLGADFVKVNYPKKEGVDSAEAFKEAIMAAGRTKVVCAGGSSTDVKSFLEKLKKQIAVGAMGNATGRNIHQKGLDEAVRMCNAVSAMTLDDKSVEEAMRIYEG